MKTTNILIAIGVALLIMMLIERRQQRNFRVPRLEGEETPGTLVDDVLTLTDRVVNCVKGVTC